MSPKFKDANKYIRFVNGKPQLRPGGLNEEILNTGNVDVLTDFLVQNMNNLTDDEKEYLRVRIDAQETFHKLREKSVSNILAGQQPQYSALTEGDGFTGFTDLQLKEKQTASQGCWSCALSLLFKSRGVDITQEQIRSWRPEFAPNNGKSPAAPAYTERRSGDVGYNIADQADMVTEILPNTAMNTMTLQPFTPDGITVSTLDAPELSVNPTPEQLTEIKAEYFSQMKDKLTETIKNAMHQHNSPVALSWDGHYVTVTGISDDGMLHVQDSQRSPADVTIPIDKVIENSMDKHQFRNNQGVNVTREPTGLEITWLQDLPVRQLDYSPESMKDGFGSYSRYVKVDDTSQLSISVPAKDIMYSEIHNENKGVLSSKGITGSVSINAAAVRDKLGYYAEFSFLGETVGQIDTFYPQKITAQNDMLLQAQKLGAVQDAVIDLNQLTNVKSDDPAVQQNLDAFRKSMQTLAQCAGESMVSPAEMQEIMKMPELLSKSHNGTTVLQTIVNSLSPDQRVKLIGALEKTDAGLGLGIDLDRALNLAPGTNFSSVDAEHLWMQPKRLAAVTEITNKAGELSQDENLAVRTQLSEMLKYEQLWENGCRDARISPASVELPEFLAQINKQTFDSIEQNGGYKAFMQNVTSSDDLYDRFKQYTSEHVLQNQGMQNQAPEADDSFNLFGNDAPEDENDSFNLLNDDMTPTGGEYQAPAQTEGYTPTGDEFQTPTGDEFQTPTGDEFQTPTGEEFQTPTGEEFQTPTGDEFQTPTGDDDFTLAGNPGGELESDTAGVQDTQPAQSEAAEEKMLTIMGKPYTKQEFIDAALEHKWIVSENILGAIYDMGKDLSPYDADSADAPQNDYYAALGNILEGVTPRSEHAELREIDQNPEYGYAITSEMLRSVLAAATKLKLDATPEYRDVFNDRSGIIPAANDEFLAFTLKKAEEDAQKAKDQFVDQVASHGWELTREQIGNIYDFCNQLPANDPENDNAPQNTFRKNTEALLNGVNPTSQYEALRNVDDNKEYAAGITYDIITHLANSAAAFSSGRIENFNQLFLSMSAASDSLKEKAQEQFLNFQIAQSMKDADELYSAEKKAFVDAASNAGWALSREDIESIYAAQVEMPVNDEKNPDAPQNKYRKMMEDMKDGIAPISMDGGKYAAMQDNPQRRELLTHELAVRLWAALNDVRIDGKKITTPAAQNVRKVFKDAHERLIGEAEKQVQDIKDEKAAEQKRIEEEKLAEQRRLAEEKEQRRLEEEKQRQAELEKQRLAELEKQRLAELEKQRQAELEKQRQAELEKQRQVELEKQRQAELEKQRLAELEKQRQAELEKQRLAELEKQRQAELEKQRQAELEKQRLAELEKQRLAELEKQRQAELERQRQAELEKQRLAELEKQRQAELERQRQAELEKQRQLQEVNAHNDPSVHFGLRENDGALPTKEELEQGYLKDNLKKAKHSMDIRGGIYEEPDDFINRPDLYVQQEMDGSNQPSAQNHDAEELPPRNKVVKQEDEPVLYARAVDPVKDTITKNLDKLHAKHRTGVGTSSDEHDKLKKSVAAFMDEIDPEARKKRLEDLAKMAENYITLKRNGDNSPDFKPETKMGQARFEAAVNILASVRQELDQMNAAQGKEAGERKFRMIPEHKGQALPNSIAENQNTVRQMLNLGRNELSKDIDSYKAILKANAAQIAAKRTVFGKYTNEQIAQMKPKKLQALQNRCVEMMTEITEKQAFSRIFDGIQNADQLFQKGMEVTLNKGDVFLSSFARENRQNQNQNHMTGNKGKQKELNNNRQIGKN